MAISLTKESIDLGIITRNPDAMVAFYRDVLGFEYEGDLEMPVGGIMHRLKCGSSLIKISTPAGLADIDAPPGGFAGASGYRYWTISVSNLDEIVEQCEKAGRSIPMAATEILPGVRIAMVEDPDGNWVEFVETPTA